MDRLYIVTPTYNRVKELRKLYSSLKVQTDKNFVWLVVDDGSNDGTGDLFQEWIQENIITIEYYFKANGGKHTAYNYALDVMGKEGYHVVVDSDDWLVETAVAIFRRAIINDTNIVGTVYPKGEKIENEIDNVLLSIVDLRIKYKIVETCILIKNEQIHDYRFPTFNGEKFMSEEVLYIHLDKIGKFRFKNYEVYHFKYLEGGLTNNLFSLWLKNPKGTLYFLEQRKKFIKKNYKGVVKIKELIKTTLNMEAIKYTISKSTYDYFSKAGIKTILIFPFVYIVSKIRFK